VIVPTAIEKIRQASLGHTGARVLKTSASSRAATRSSDLGHKNSSKTLEINVRNHANQQNTVRMAM